MTNDNRKKKAAPQNSDALNNSVDFRSASKNKIGFLPATRDALVNRYFDDIARFDGFDGEEDIEAAREIAELEIGLWQKILCQPQRARIAAKRLRLLIEEQGQSLNEPEFARALIDRFLDGLKKSRDRKEKRLVCLGLVEQVADQLHRTDTDRQLIDAVAVEMERAKGKRGRMDGVPLDAFKREMNSSIVRIKAAKRRFIESHLGLVVAIARSFYRGQMPLLDLIQEGNLGLIKAVDRYDYNRGFRFVTYATWWIRATIGRAITDKGQAVRVPANTYHTRARIDRAAEAIRARQGRAPTRDELQAETGLSEGSLTRIRETGSVVVYSLDQKIPGTDDHTYVDLLEDENCQDPFESTFNSTWTTLLPRLLDTLTPLERTILHYRFGFADGQERTLKEVGESVNLSRERIRQLQNQALRKLKKQLSLSAA